MVRAKINQYWLPTSEQLRAEGHVGAVVVTADDGPLEVLPPKGESLYRRDRERATNPIPSLIIPHGEERYFRRTDRGPSGSDTWEYSKPHNYGPPEEIVEPVNRLHIPAVVTIDAMCPIFGEDEHLDASQVRDLIANSSHGMVVLCRGEVAGFAFCRDVDAVRRVEYLAVHPNFRRRGLGRLLLNCIMRYLPDDRRCIEIPVPTSDDGAMAFCDACGLAETAIDRNFFAGVEDGRMMRITVGKDYWSKKLGL